MGVCNTQTLSKQAITLSNYSNPINPPWLDKDAALECRYKRNFVDLGENLFS